jgi:hypothetical protein
MRPFVLYARAEHARICGVHVEALAWIERAHEQVRPGEHPVWPWLVASSVFTLLAQGRYEQARQIGLRGVETAERVGLTIVRGNIDMPLALAEAKLSDFASACARLERLIAERMDRGWGGIALGLMHELRARIAVWMNDAQAFDHHAQLCAQHFRKTGGEPAIAARYERLLQEARQHGLALDSQVSEAMAPHTTLERTDTSREIAATVGAALSRASSREQRLQSALELIVKAASAQDGELFVLGGTSLVLAASTARDLGGATLLPALCRMLDMDRSGADATACTAVFETHGCVRPDGASTRVWPLLLVHARDSGTAVAGVVALHFEASASVRLPAEVASAVAAALIDAGDVTPRSIAASATTVRG